MEFKYTIHGLFEAQAEKSPDAIAIQFNDQSITYRTLNERANQLAHFLQDLGVKQEVKIALCMDRSIELFITIIGILKAGGAYVPLDSTHPDDRLLYLLNDTNSPIVILKSGIKEKFIQYSGQKIEFESINIKLPLYPIRNLVPISSENNLAYVIYTSGSTGNPKGVLIEHHSVVNYCLWFADYSCCRPQQRIDFSSKYIFDMSVSVTVVPLMLGWTVTICGEENKRNERHYLRYLQQNQINLIKLTPSYFKVLLHEIKNKFIELPYLRSIILGGENLPVIDCKSWLESYPEHILFNEYGPTEATIAVSQYKVDSKTISFLDVNVPIGKPGPDMYCYILDPDNMPMPDGMPGELSIGGVGLARSYLNQPERTHEKFIKNSLNERLYKTGDLCRKLADGTLEYFGRIDDQIKIHGFRIEPGEIETCLALYPAIDQVVVLVREDSNNEKRLIAYFTLKSHKTKDDVLHVRQYLETKLPEYMIPTSFVRLETLPLTASGKIDKAELPIPIFMSSQYYLAPSTDMEKTVAAIWSEELQVKPIGIKDDFFELGGDSLSASRIISTLNNKLTKDLSLKEFYRAPNIAQLVKLLNNAHDVKEQIPKLNESLYEDTTLLPLSDFQFLLWTSNRFEPKAKKINIVTRKRMQGRLNKVKLDFAINAVLKKHEPLVFQIKTLSPAQIVQKKHRVGLIEQNINSLTLQETELVLEDSYNELLRYYPWRNTSLLQARLFIMDNNLTELQICMPHIIADAISLDVLLADLSYYYLNYGHNLTIDNINTSKYFREYLFNEQYYSKKGLDRDIIFWDQYLKDVSLFTFPPETVVIPTKSQAFSYSTYLEIPERCLSDLKLFCATHQVSMKNALSAALALALNTVCNKPQRGMRSIFMNVVKSTRDSKKYDDIIGCFLRIEPLKIDISAKSTLTNLSRKIHRSEINSAPYQRCSSFVKLASLGEFRLKSKTIKSFFIHPFVSLYTALFPTLKLSPKTLKLLMRLTSLKKSKQFLINLNIQNNFILNDTRKKQLDLFGLKSQNTEMSFLSLLEIDYVLDACFMRDEQQNKPYLVVSANLTPSFRESIAKELIQIINTGSVI